MMHDSALSAPTQTSARKTPRRSNEEGPRRRTPTPATSDSSRQKSIAPTTLNSRKQHSAGPSARRRCFKRSPESPHSSVRRRRGGKQPAYQTRRFHAVSVKRRPLSRHGLLEQGTRLWLGLSPATPHDSTRVIVRPRRLVPSPHNLILHMFCCDHWSTLNSTERLAVAARLKRSRSAEKYDQVYSKSSSDNGTP